MGTESSSVIDVWCFCGTYLGGLTYVAPTRTIIRIPPCWKCLELAKKEAYERGEEVGVGDGER